MKSVKPGRGPSMMSGIVGIFMVCFGIFWTAMTARFSGIFAIFGILWTCMALAITVYNFKNATSKNRYSQFDITDGNEEPDPLNVRYGGQQEYQDTYSASGNTSAFCPYCGAPAAGDYEFCNKCGRLLP